MSKLIIALLILVGFSSCANNKYVDYEPRYLSSNGEHKYFEEPELDSTEFANTIQVLKYYGEKYRTNNHNVILITKKLSKNWTLKQKLDSKKRS